MELILPHKEYYNALIPGIFAFINEVDKKIEVRYSQCISSSMVSILREIKLGSLRPKDIINDFHDNKLRFRILEEIPNDRSIGNIKKQYWIDEYRKQGYSTYKILKQPVYKIRIDIENYLVCVSIENLNSIKTIVGIFDKMKDAKQFIKQYYNKDKINDMGSIVVANNPLTRHHFLEINNFL